ncbi:MAG: hypothetical protein ACP5D9_18855, partial [Mariniphaga sp.]
DTAQFFRENVLGERIFLAEAEKTIVAWQHNIVSGAKSNPALLYQLVSGPGCRSYFINRSGKLALSAP